MSEAAAKEAAKDAKEAPKEGADGAVVEAPSKLKQLLPYIVGGVLSIGFGLGSGIVTAPKHEDPSVIEKHEEPPPTPLDALQKPFPIVLPSLNVNLADSGAGRLNLVVEIRAKDLEKQAEIDAGCAKGGALAASVRDALIILLSGKQSSELKTPRGKEILKLEVLDKLKPILFPDPADGAITGIYFDECLLQ